MEKNRPPNAHCLLIGAGVVGTNYGIFYLFTLHLPEQVSLLEVQGVSAGVGIITGVGLYSLLSYLGQPEPNKVLVQETRRLPLSTNTKLRNTKKGESELFGLFGKKEETLRELEKPNYKERVRSEFKEEDPMGSSTEEVEVFNQHFTPQPEEVVLRERSEEKVTDKANVPVPVNKGSKVAKEALFAIKGLLETVQETDTETWQQALGKVAELEGHMETFESHMEAMMVASSEIRTGLRQLNNLISEQVGEDVV